MDFPMEVRLNGASPLVRENLGLAAVTCGPLCYCLEQADNGGGLHLLRVDATKLGEGKREPIAIGGREMRAITLPGFCQKPPEPGAPLYTVYARPEETPADLKFVPYYAWANRGPGEMRVWVRVC